MVYTCEICKKTFKRKYNFEKHTIQLNCTRNKIATCQQLNYSAKTRLELIAICKKNNIKGYSRKRKDAILKLIEDTQKNKSKSILIKEQIVEEQIVEKEKKKIITEDLGKIFEMSICLLYEIEYDGKYKYGLEEANKIKEKLQNLKKEFPFKLKHIAKNGNKYDFTTINDEQINLSAKTTKKDAKVCPQVIGQPSKKKFCEFFGLDVRFNLDQIKSYIEFNVKKLLEIYFLNTFVCPIIYYNKHKNLLLFVKLIEIIKWENYNIKFSHTLKNKKWNESSSIMVDNITIGEFQIHNHRDCIKFRWSFEKVLEIFSTHFKISKNLIL